MKITILTVGSRGDVQPFAALARGLQSAGHTVTLAANTSFAGFITGLGLRYAPLRADFLELAQTAEGRAALAGSGGRLALMRRVMPMLRQILDDAWEAARGSDLIVYHPKALAGYHIAEKLRVPGFAAMALPALTPTRDFPNPILPPGLRLGGWFNRLTTSALLPLISAPYHRLVNRWRRDTLFLPPRGFLSSELKRDGRPVPVLYAFSAHVVPRPRDWDDAALVTGYWFLDRAEAWQPPAALEDFLRAGPPPVYVGFGSMPARNPRAAAEAVIAALRQAGQRGVLASGWGGLEAAALPESMYLLDSAPHDWLFPRMAAVVHHGGAGTTAAGLRAGRPTVICPFFGDQPFWGSRVQALGAGPAPIPQRRLTAGRLAAAINAAVSDSGLRARAEALGQKIRAENGVTRAVQAVESFGHGYAPAAVSRPALGAR